MRQSIRLENVDLFDLIKETKQKFSNIKISNKGELFTVKVDGMVGKTRGNREEIIFFLSGLCTAYNILTTTQ